MSPVYGKGKVYIVFIAIENVNNTLASGGQNKIIDLSLKILQTEAIKIKY